MTAEDLDRYVANYTDFNAWLIRARYRLLRRFFQGQRCLELGPSTGEGTAYLLEHFDTVVSVDGSSQVVEELRRRFPDSGLRAVHSFFEDLQLDEVFDTVVLAHILEHVADPHEVLLAARRFLAPGGVMIIDVPNALSLHRQLGVELGMLERVTDLHAGDLSIGHRRVYTPETFRAEVEGAGLRVERFGGVFLKLVSNAQCEQLFTEEMLDGLLAIGERYPELAAEIYLTART